MNKQPTERNAAVRALTRREALGLLGAGAAVILTARSAVKAGLTFIESAAAAIVPSCVVRPEQTEGPYFIDEKLNRSDIRSDPSDGSVKPGVPLRVAFHVSRISGNSCSPLSGALVDLWQCDAQGIYSDVRDARFDTRGKKFLRGYQTTDANGVAEFLTIYPGWYPGRAVHVHFKIRSEPPPQRAQEFTSQLYFDESITDQVYQQAPYNSKGSRRTTNDMDGLFRRGGKQLIPTLTKDGSHGYTAKFDIGLRLT